MISHGNVPVNSVLPFFFDTYAGSTGASITMTGLALGDIFVYKGTSMTQRTSTAGIVLLDTDGIDIDTLTGIHGFSIDTSDNTDAGFYAVGSFFTVVVSTITVDSQTVSFVAGTFRLVAAEGVAGKPKVDVDAWLGTAAATPTVAGVPEVDVTHWIGTAAATPTVAGVPEVDLTHVAGSTTSVSVLASNVATLIADIGGVATAAADGDPTSTDLLFAYIKQLINVLVGSAGVVTFPAAAAPANAVSLAEIIRAIYDDTNALPDSGALTTVQSDLDNIQTRLPAALVSGKMDSVADVTAISGDTTAADNLESEYDGTGYGHVLQRTTIATLSSQTSFTLTAGSADNDAYKGCVIVIQDATTAAQKAVAVISAYTGASKTVTLLNDPAIFTMAATDIVTIIADRALKATVDNRTLDVSAGGEAGLDWANIGSPTTAQNLSATNIDVDQVVASVSGAVGSVTGAVGSVTGAVGSVAAGGITAASIATNAIDADALAADAITEIQAGLATPTNITAGTITTVTNLTNAPTSGDLTATMKASINAEVVDVVATDTITLPGQTAPPAAPTHREVLGWLFKLIRNRQTQTATQWSLMADNETTVDAKATVSDDGTTAIRQEVVSGP